MLERNAVLLGATGLVGGFCLKTLVDDPIYTRVLLFGRRELPFMTTRAKVVQRIADLGNLQPEDFHAVHDVFCALGTTIKKAGSQAAFRHVDFELPLHAATAAAKSGAERFVVVTSVGASAASNNFYLRVKGELERALAGLSFKAVHILRPSLLLGKRTEFRLGEAITMKIAPALDLLTLGSLRKYHSIRAELVGRAMVGTAKEEAAGVVIHEYDSIVKMSAR